jgi:hypothetical protein
LAGGCSSSSRSLGVVLLVSAGLLIRTFVHLSTLDPGFDDSHLLTASVSMQDARYRESQAVAHLFEDSTARLRAVPGVQNAAVALGTPYSRLLNDGIQRLDGAHIDKPGDGQITNETYVTPGFFETLKIPVRAGRAIEARDTAGAPQVAVVNEAFVARYYKDDPQVVGRHLGPGTPREIIGIVGNTQQGPPAGATSGRSPAADGLHSRRADLVEVPDARPHVVPARVGRPQHCRSRRSSPRSGLRLPASTLSSRSPAFARSTTCAARSSRRSAS